MSHYISTNILKLSFGNFLDMEYLKYDIIYFISGFCLKVLQSYRHMGRVRCIVIYPPHTKTLILAGTPREVPLLATPGGLKGKVPHILVWVLL